MEYRPIPFTSMDLSVDKPKEAAAYGQLQCDGYWKRNMSPDGPKFIWCKRPGLATWVDLSDTDDVWDLFYSQKADRIIAVLYPSGQVYKVNVATGVVNEMTDGDAMDGGLRPTFAEWGSGAVLYIANGKEVTGFTLASNTAAVIGDADCPTTVHSIGVLNNVLIAARVDSRRFDWCDAGDPDTWAGEFATCESSPGYTRCMKIADNYIWFFKTDQIEVWRDDGSTFIREQQGVIKVGTRNSGSIRYINGSFYFMDTNLDIRKLTGFNWPETISNPELAGYISTITDFDDVEGHHLKWDGKDFYILQFWGSSSNVPCLVYDIELNQWYKWGSYNTGTGARNRWPISGICTAQNGVWYAGDYNEGKIHTISGTLDLTSDIYSQVRTDFIDRRLPDTFKYCHELTLLFKRSSTSTTAKTMSIRYRDDGSQTWSTAITASIEQASTTELRVNVRRLGRYKRRMWEFTISDATQAALIGAWERYSVGS